MNTRSVLCAALFFCLAPAAIAANYATCILDSMGDIQNDAAVYAARKICFEKHPGGFDGVKKGSGKWMFGFNSGAECTVKKSANTPNRQAGMMIGAACRCLYDDPLVDGYSCTQDTNARTFNQ